MQIWEGEYLRGCTEKWQYLYYIIYFAQYFLYYFYKPSSGT